MPKITETYKMRDCVCEEGNLQTSDRIFENFPNEK